MQNYVLLGAALFCCGPSGGAPSNPVASSITAPSPTPFVPGDVDAGPASCPRVSDPQATGHIDSPDVNEASGIVASEINPNVFWVHNDSGDSARGFAISRTGKLMATLVYDANSVLDVEDIAIEDVAPNASNLYFGDIGDNGGSRTELTIHRVSEPKLGSNGGQPVRATSEKMRVSYPDGSHDAETLLFDPLTKDLFIATKKFFGTAIYRIGPFSAGGTVTMERIASAAADFVTGGDISRDGRFIALRNYTASAFLWTREPGESLAAALARRPCRLPLAAETQGEAFGFLAQGSGYVTISEGQSPELHIASFE